MDVDLLCNSKKCRKRLGKYAWVTSCSHIFCDEDGTREFSKSATPVCPACETALSGQQQDIVRVDIEPSDQYKSMVLAGQRPEVVMEICSRAISFWSYQACYERTYQEYVSSHAKEKCAQLKQHYEQALSRSQSELQSLKQQLLGVKKENDEEKKRYSDISEKLLERNRQYQKLQAMYDNLRRRAITPGSFGHDEPRVSARQRPPVTTPFDMPLGVQSRATNPTEVETLFSETENASSLAVSEPLFALQNPAKIKKVASKREIIRNPLAERMGDEHYSLRTPPPPVMGHPVMGHPVMPPRKM
ncbi:E3 ubiquitin-protein ligase CCNB1IP1-like [Oscarella lobularis]|uniref:E3 ubiquitin-protein ligase CCNB1IP1-like n=1 Tax=Oscarella lobularis TaxID=121494 RepID=UPI0033133E3B